MTNSELIMVGILGVFLVFIFSMMYHNPTVTTYNTPAPLPINLYTNGVANGNTNDVANRVNFLQQPVGNNYS
jgi:DMSO reductase anchor subunit